MMNIHRFSFPTQIFFGAGCRREVGPFLKSRSFRRALIVTDRGLAQLPLVAAIRENLNAFQLAVQVFSGVTGNPVKSQVEAGVEAFKRFEADAIVGVGGGAALDVAKAIALMARHPGDLFDYEDGKAGALPIEQEIPFWVAVPTTAGTGSEVGRSSVISDERTKRKKIIFSPRLLAQAVFADPELTIGLPASLTAATGMDALTHCIEAYLAKDYHPICDGVALEGLKLAARNLVRCVTTPSDLEARGGMMMASMMGAIAFQKGLGLTHSCAHALSTAVDLHHGLANGIMIDHALAFNIEAEPRKFDTLSQVIGLENRDGLGVIRWLERLKSDAGIPATLSQVGVNAGWVEQLAELAFEDSCHQNNPRPCTWDDFRGIYLKAMGGEKHHAVA